MPIVGAGQSLLTMLESLATRTFPADASAPSRARAALRLIPELQPVRDEAELIISELVTNAVRHSGAVDADVIVVDVSRDHEKVRLSVRDPGRSDTSPEVHTPDEEPGRVGLFIVSRTATRWHTEPRDGLVVWAELSLE